MLVKGVPGIMQPIIKLNMTGPEQITVILRTSNCISLRKMYILIRNVTVVSLSGSEMYANNFVTLHLSCGYQRFSTCYLQIIFLYRHILPLRIREKIANDSCTKPGRFSIKSC